MDIYGERTRHLNSRSKAGALDLIWLRENKIRKR